jgi:hypothetical protein
MRGMSMGGDRVGMENGKIPGGTIRGMRTIRGRMRMKRTIPIAPPPGAIHRQNGNAPLPASGGTGHSGKRVCSVPARWSVVFLDASDFDHLALRESLLLASSLRRW